MSDCDKCKKGYTEGVEFPEFSDNIENEQVFVKPSGKLKISNDPVKLRVSNTSSIPEVADQL